MPTPSAHRFLLKQADGSFTAYELSNTSPYSTIRTIPHFDHHLSACATNSTDLFTYIVLSLTPTPSGGYLVTYENQNGQTYFDILDASLTLVGEAPGIPAIMFADMNGDGKLDAISTTSVNHNAAISISLSAGGTTFMPPVVYPTLYPSIQVLLVADVNNDHKPDIVVLGFGQIAVYLGNGDGTLESPKAITQETGTGASMALADLNGDGILDLIYPDQTGLKVSLGMGDGTFQTPKVIQPTPALYGGLAVGDLNGDGIPDIFIGGAILFGDGKGGFPTQTNVALRLLNASQQPIITDFDGDGIADLVFGQGTPSVIAGDSVSVIFGLGKGKFAAPPETVVSSILNGSNLVEPIGIASADFNRDGFADLVVAQLNGAVVVLKGVGDGTFQPTFSFQFGFVIPYAAVIGDFNHDGNLDFAVVGSGYTASSTGGVAVVLGNGDGTFQAPNQFAVPLGALAMAAGDFNGDGNLDLAVVNSQSGPDVGSAKVSESVTILLGDGSGHFKPGTSYPAGPYVNSVVAGDFNGDGKIDLVIANNGSYAQKQTDASLVFLAGKGDGTFASPVLLPVVGGPNRGPYNVAVADFNGDGKLDLAVTLNLGGLMILLGHGDGTFQTPVYYAVGNYAVTVGDLNGDSIPDLITTGYYLLGNGDGSFKSPVPVPGVLDPMVLADLNHDGKLDIAASTGAGVAGYLNVTPPPTSVVVTSAASLEPSPLAPSSIATIFGKNLSGTTAVSIQDISGANSLASVPYTSPSQINFVAPSGLEAGPATLTITSGNASQTVQIEVASVQPSLFTLNSGGLAAAYVTRASSSGATYEPIFSEKDGVITPVPIDVSAPAGQAYLVMFGTGIRNTIGARFSINGNFVSPSYAGPQPSFPGLDQVNLPLPSNLGSGYTNLILSQGSLIANPVYVVIK